MKKGFFLFSFFSIAVFAGALFNPSVTLAWSNGTGFGGGAGSLGAFGTFDSIYSQVTGTSSNETFGEVSFYATFTGTETHRCRVRIVGDDSDTPNFDHIRYESSYKSIDPIPSGNKKISFDISDFTLSIAYKYWIGLQCDYISSTNSLSPQKTATTYPGLLDTRKLINDESTAYTYTDAMYIELDTGLLDTNYVITTLPCASDSRSNSNESCPTSLMPVTEIDGVVNTSQDNMKLEILVYDSGRNLIDSTSFFYSEPTYTTFDWYTVTVSTTTEAVYYINACVLPSDAFASFGYGNCTSIEWGNGTTTHEYLSWIGRDDADAMSTYNELGCADVSILSFASSTYCALLWAFEPSNASMEKFGEVKNKLLFIIPIGYATHVVNDLKDLSATSTQYSFDMNAFGLSSTTIDFDATAYGESAYTDFPTMFDTAEKFVWILFGIWVVGYGVSRRFH